MYDETIKRIDGQNERCRQLAKHVFIWVVTAYQQLSLKELQHALAVSSDSEITEIDPSSLVNEMILTSVCAGLVVVDQGSNVVRLVRKSITLY
jgi:hypothetical protein